MLPLHISNSFEKREDALLPRTESQMAGYIFQSKHIQVNPPEWLAMKILQAYYYSVLAHINSSEIQGNASLKQQFLGASEPYLPEPAIAFAEQSFFPLLIERACSLAAWSENRAILHIVQIWDISDFNKVLPLTFLWNILENKKIDSGIPEMKGKSIAALLKEPAEKFPDSLVNQANFILQARSHWLAMEFTELVSLAKDVLAMAQVTRKKFGTDSGIQEPPPAELESYDSPPNYRPDRTWMNDVVIQAKSAFVWLYQLSQKYGKSIQTLGDVPNEELVELRSAGFGGLWLIGLWERSIASKTIKQRKGNPEAEASAYAIDRYEISSRLGGESALHILQEKCREAGLRLCADMVPNHMGLDSEYVKTNPDLFMQTSYPPFPSYSFKHQPVFEDDHRRILIEDGYFTETDAAVTYLLHEKNTNRQRFIYHGNDGTRMPWNDTAQFDFIRQETREFVKNLIRSVASRFSIIRFDAAMVLTRKHIRRLWYPHPNKVHEVIASREYHTMTDEDFQNAMPHEFWLEVTEMVAREFPDTLLIAEAFWLLEKYFVRHLGMHRVYHSAFMHFLHKEQNQKFRTYLKEILSAEPEMLRRFVHFLSNPDEEPAAETFGTGDKYFSAATLLLTMPGLPLWAHGQTLGFHEKYGMEYSRSYHDEKPDQKLLERHEREIFPLMRKRSLFAKVQNFTVSDFTEEHGRVNENVYVIANHEGSDNALILVNHAFQGTKGRIDFFHVWKNFHLEAEFILYENFLIQKTYICKRTEFFNHDHLFSLSGYGRQIFLNFRNSSFTHKENILLHEHIRDSGCRDIGEMLLFLKARENYQMICHHLNLEVERVEKEAGTPRKKIKKEKNNKNDEKISGNKKNNKTQISTTIKSIGNYTSQRNLKISRPDGKKISLGEEITLSDVFMAVLLTDNQLIQQETLPFPEIETATLWENLLKNWYKLHGIHDNLPLPQTVSTLLKEKNLDWVGFISSKTFCDLWGGHTHENTIYLVEEHGVLLRKWLILRNLITGRKLIARKINEELALFDFYHDSVKKNGYDFRKFTGSHK